MALPVTAAAMKSQWKNLLVAVSLGHLMFVRRWYDLEHLQAKALDYYRGVAADDTLAAATLAASLLLAVVFRVSWLWVERHPSRFRVTLGHCAFLTMLVLPLETMRRFWNVESGRYDWFTNLSLFTVEGLLAAGIVLRLGGSMRILETA